MGLSFFYFTTPREHRKNFCNKIYIQNGHVILKLKQPTTAYKSYKIDCIFYSTEFNVGLLNRIFSKKNKCRICNQATSKHRKYIFNEGNKMINVFQMKISLYKKYCPSTKAKKRGWKYKNLYSISRRVEDTVSK